MPHYYFFCLSPPLLLYLCLMFCPSLSNGRWQWPSLAGAVEDLASGSFSPSHFVSPLTLCCYRLERGHIQDEKQVSQEKCESLYAFSWYQHQLPLSHSCPSPSSLFAYSPLLYPFSFSIVCLAQWLCALSLFPLSLSALCLLLDCLSVCLCLCAGVLTRETERERVRVSVYSLMHLCVCACRGACWQTEVGGGTD